MSSVKLGEDTLDILRNFSNIRHSFLFKPGNVLQVAAANASVLVRACIDETIPAVAPVAKLSRFLACVDMVGKDDCEIEFNDGYFSLISPTMDFRYIYAKEQLVEDNYNIRLEVEDEVISFRLSDSTLRDINNAYRYIRSNDPKGRVAFTTENGSVYAIVFEEENRNDKLIDGSQAKILVEVLETEVPDGLFAMVLMENLKLIPGDYHVLIGNISRFSHTALDLHYWIALEE